MKKVFALVLALAMMMMATTAWAKDISTASDSFVVATKYTASDPINVTITWDDPAAVAYIWDAAANGNAGGWTTSTGNQSVAFTITNKGFADRTIKLTNGELTENVQKFVQSVDVTNPEDKVVNGTNASATATITYNTTLAKGVIADVTATETAIGNISFTVTVS